MAMLLQKAVSGSRFDSQSYNNLPSSGIILIYDTTILDNQACKVMSNGKDDIRFLAAEDNGLYFGIYQYLQELGFRFYQPGAIWEITPSGITAFKNMDTTYTCRFTYKSWFITGGHNRWVMDNANEYPWDTYFGENGHQWALYQRRNGMNGSRKFMGHRGDIMTDSYLLELQNNPCFTACYAGKRTVNQQSVPDVNNLSAMKLWSNAIAQKYTQYKNAIYGNKGIYANFFRNFEYQQGYIGLEVPDGAHWANSKDNSGCNDLDYKKESDQHFILANYGASQLNALYPEKRFQVYAYDGHANIPALDINRNIDVQVVATGFQSETSADGLLNRWYNKTNHLSEYQYLNLTQWSGETPSFYLKDLTSTLQRLKDKNSQGIIWEASPAKFASLPFLLAANKDLTSNIPVDSTLHEFCNTLFAGAANSIFKLLQSWGNDNIVTTGDWMNDNKYKIPLYLQLIQEASEQTQNSPSIVKERIGELKAYLHYMILFYDWAFDQRSQADKAAKAGELCIYLAEINKLQLVNSYFLISLITSRYSASDPLYTKYNVNNGTAYQNGQLPLITSQKIEQDFLDDYNHWSGLIQQYKFETAATIKTKFKQNKMVPLETLHVHIVYTNGKDYPNRSEFYIDASNAGSFSIKYTPQFDMPGNGYINFTVESLDRSLQIIKDYSIDNTNGAGTINVVLPGAGAYKLSVVSKYKSSADLVITTNGNYFYKNGAWLGTPVENYRSNLLSLPGYFYIPAGISRVYFSINNSNPGGKGFATPLEISKAFLFKDNNGFAVVPHLVTNSDSALFYLDVVAGNDHSFWQVFKMEQYRLSFINISNHQWYARREPCSSADFSTTIVAENGACITRLKNTSKSNNTQWSLYDAGISYDFTNLPEIEVPVNFSPNTMITLTIDGNCSVTRRLGDNLLYLKQKEACASGAPVSLVVSKANVYPNPGMGVFYCAIGGNNAIASEITLFNTMGAVSARFKNTSSFDISRLPSGVYLFRMVINGEQTQGKLLKR